ncbi:uncharacterized protein BXZ73DRAFT_55352 [Epithele typhae]|uniref:uncharacterized protein n=1 Tax=Epithele typhae TaxID=378194 RepID=UPI002008C5F7|nr:uncharacterized protein BXZ73DRAFT_55352 [Epithele typhae]KAH9913806.1 hypothetical protein BXZ73DRAFT_55352 [Epithele typhae]
MEDVLIAIPGATALHVLNERSVALGAGDLTLVPAAQAETALTVRVGPAAFALERGTPFGTVAGDARAYVFEPRIEGGAPGGFVKILLPEAVTEDGSRLSALQERFEEILIEHGLLQPAEDVEGTGGGGEHKGVKEKLKAAIHVEDSEELVTIPDAIAAQILGERTEVLSAGTLALLLMPLPERDQEGQPVLTLVVGTSAFPLYCDTAFGTLADDSRTYVFKPQTAGTDKGYVAIVLPDPTAPAPDSTPSSDLAALQNQFELALIEHGLLKDGLAAVADDLARSLSSLGARLAAARDRYLARRPAPRVTTALASPTPVNSPSSAWPASPVDARPLVEGAKEAAGAVWGVAGAAGKWLTKTFGPMDPLAAERMQRQEEEEEARARGSAGDKDTEGVEAR